MAKGNFLNCLGVTLAYEGGYVNNPKDPGGATNMGITAATLAHWRGVPSVTPAVVKGLTKAEAADIYEARYWKKLAGDELPAGLDLAVFDYGVHSGPFQAAKDLQRALGIKGVDGKIGPFTTKAAQGIKDASLAIKALCARRGSLLRGLATWEVFKRGWSSRLAHVEATAISMWLKATNVGPGTTTTVLQDEAEAAGDKAATQTKGAGKTVATGGVTGAAGAGADMTGAIPHDATWVVIAVVLLALASAAVLMLKAKQNRERASAYALAAWVH